MHQPLVYMRPPPWIPLLLPFPSHPSGLLQCTGSQCPVSCIELGLVICFTYGNIHVSKLFSQIIPPSPSPMESASLFFLSAPPLLPRAGLLKAGRLEHPDGWLNLENFILIFWSLVPCPEFGPLLKYRAIMDEAFFLCKNQWSQSIHVCVSGYPALISGQRCVSSTCPPAKLCQLQQRLFLSIFTCAPGEHL